MDLSELDAISKQTPIGIRCHELNRIWCGKMLYYHFTFWT